VATPELAGRVCLVTGATSGIGRATAMRLARHDVRLLVSGRDTEALGVVAAAAGGTAIPADLSRRDEVERLAESAVADQGRVDVLVNAAGEGLHGPVAELGPADLERVVAVNLTAPILLTTALLEGMLERRAGHIVHVGSIAGHVGHREEATYAATKAALTVFSESLHAELAGTGVAVTLITPGVVDTAFFERRGAPYDRRWPRPIPADRVAARIVDALSSRPAEVIVPGWLSAPVRLRGALPGLYRSLARRFD
jgi:short-subunit dehydrogenase